MNRSILEDYRDSLRVVEDLEAEIRRTHNQALVVDLIERQRVADKKRHEIELWMRTIPSRMQRLISYRCFERMRWNDIEICMDYGTAESLRKEYKKFLDSLDQSGGIES